MKRNYRITISVTQEEWDALYWLSFEERTTPAGVAYKLFQDSMVRLLDGQGPMGKRWAAYRVQMRDRIGEVVLPFKKE